VAAVSEQGQLLTDFRHARPGPGRSAEADQQASPAKRRGLRLPLLGSGALSREGRLERAEAKERRRAEGSVEAARESFFMTPAGRARLAYKRGHQLFQYELAVGEVEPTIVPGRIGSAARETTDPVDILNSVTAEGWKLVTGKFFSSEMHGGAVGCYLFKRSQKRRQPMNNPWQAAS
jgi:hypothetical protein